MGFQEFDITRQKSMTSGATGVSTGLSKLKNNKARLRISLRKQVLDEAKWVKSTRFKVLLGSGDDAGKLRFAPDETGPAQLTERKIPRASGVMFALALGHLESLPDIIAPSEPCQFEVLEGLIIEIALPAWSRRPKTVERTVPGAETELQRQHREAQERRARLGMKP